MNREARIKSHYTLLLALNAHGYLSPTNLRVTVGFGLCLTWVDLTVEDNVLCVCGRRCLVGRFLAQPSALRLRFQGPSAVRPWKMSCPRECASDVPTWTSWTSKSNGPTGGHPLCRAAPRLGQGRADDSGPDRVPMRPCRHHPRPSTSELSLARQVPATWSELALATEPVRDRSALFEELTIMDHHPWHCQAHSSAVVVFRPLADTGH